MRLIRLAAYFIALALSAGSVFVVVAAKQAVETMPDPARLALSTVVTDREGKVLRAFLTPEGVWRFQADLKAIDPDFIDALILVEDKRFRDHPGVDPLAVGRALGQIVTSGRVVSGASTITMQVVRLLDPQPRTLWSKFIEACRAIALERQLSKDQILELYLTLAPYGGNLEGIRAASLAYFGKEPLRLTASETALLIAIPQSPEVRRPDRHLELAVRVRDSILERLFTLGRLDDITLELAKADSVPATRLSLPFSAPHLARRLVADRQGQVIRTTIDAELQRKLEHKVEAWKQGHEAEANLAIVIAEAADGSVRAHVGSADFFDSLQAGQVDLTRALRSPGSTLKPLIYAMAIEEGFLDPRTLVVDAPGRVTGYAPENFAKTYLGDTTAAEALRHSLNQPAVQILEHYGPQRFVGRLQRAGIRVAFPRDSERPGLAVALGGLGTTLEDLVSLYSSLRDGDVRTLRFLEEEEVAAAHPLVNAGPAWEVRRILSDQLGVPKAVRSLAWKTGTSYGFRDAWAIGLVDRYVIGVWVGRPDGTPRPGHFGRNTAAPLLFDAAYLLTKNLSLSEPLPPEGWAPMEGRALPAALQYFPPQPIGNTYRSEEFTMNLPPEGSVLDLTGTSGLSLSATGGRRPLVWIIDGRPVPSPAHRRDLWWEPEGPGFAEIVVIDADGKYARAKVEIKSPILKRH